MLEVQDPDISTHKYRMVMHIAEHQTCSMMQQAPRLPDKWTRSMLDTLG